MGKVRKKLKLHIKTKGNIVRCLPLKARLICADNSGAKELEVIAVKEHKTRKRQINAAGVSDMIVCSVKKGTPDIKKEVVNAVVIRQKKEYLRPDGTHMKFSDNAAVVVTPDGEMKGTEIRGPVAKEAAQKWSSINTVARVVV